MVVSGVFKKPLQNSQLVFDMVRLIGETDSRCYLRLSKKSGKAEIEKLFLEKKASIPVINTGTPVPYFIEPLKKHISIHPVVLQLKSTEILQTSGLPL